MKKYYEDREYLNKVYDILNHDEFKKMENIVHHGVNRLNHSIRVSYYSYKIAKFLKLDNEKVARAALLHDFFFEKNSDLNKKEKVVTMLNHPKYAVENAKKYFELSELEEDIILTHMFPVAPKVPKYFESWMVDLVDDIASVYERSSVISRQLSTATCFLIMILVNNLR